MDFPFILPNGAKAYKVKNDGTATEISTTFIPARTPVLLSWPASDSKTEVKLMPGLLTQAEINEAASKIDFESWEKMTYNYILDNLTDETTATTAFGTQTVQVLTMMAKTMLGDEGQSMTTDQILNVVQGMRSDNSDNNLTALFMVVNATRNIYFYLQYQNAFGALNAQKEQEAATLREQIMQGNDLWWCGDFFAYDEKSSKYGQEPSLKGYSRLSAISDGKPVFGKSVGKLKTGEGNMAFLPKETHDLNWLVQNGEVGREYEIEDELRLVYLYDIGTEWNIFAKDNDNYSNRDIAQDGEINYVQKNFSVIAPKPLNKGSYTYVDDQSNWVMIKANTKQLEAASNLGKVLPDYETTVSEQLTMKRIYVSKIKGTYTDAVNPTITLTAELSDDNVTVTPSNEVTKNDSELGVNVFIPANFYSYSTQHGSNGKDYFFVRPKPNEVAKITWSVFDKDKKAMAIPVQAQGQNEASLQGAFPISEDYDLQNIGSLDYRNDKAFIPNQSYSFYAVIQKKPGASRNARRRAEITGDFATLDDCEYIVYPLDSNSGEGGDAVVVTAVNEVAGNKVAASTQYVNLAGQRSNRPWQGINIVVTRYTDGTTATTKVIL
ncbi:MAG: hypothetical protein IJ808_00880 [Muribaculaceae bacterium]|nr:hypothetical protein [Muribaculaceae bacterium]